MITSKDKETLNEIRRILDRINPIYPSEEISLEEAKALFGASEIEYSEGALMVLEGK